MNNQITITFASRADFDQALRQITKARDYRARGKQLGTLGQGLLLSTLERAELVATGHEHDWKDTLQAIANDASRFLDDEMDLTPHEMIEGIRDASLMALRP